MEPPVALNPENQTPSQDAGKDSPSIAGTSRASSAKAGLFRRAYRGARWLSGALMDWFGATHLRRGAVAIGMLAGRLRAPPARDRRFKTESSGGFDMRATAFSYGLSVVELEARFALRRRQTAWLTYGTFALSVGFLLAWIRQALHVELTASRLTLALHFLPFCVLFFLIAFYYALLNFKIRTRRTAGWREYLTTEEAFLPR